MKTKILIFITFIMTNVMAIAQSPIVDFGQEGYDLFDSPEGTYIKDINNRFDKYIGTWKYQNGNEILIFKLEKVIQHYDSEFKIYSDFMKGNYSYSTDGGITFIVNTITTNLGNNNPENNAMYKCCPYEIDGVYNFSFKDIIYNKEGCSAIFKFVGIGETQLNVKLVNRGRGYILPEVPPTPNFSIPNNVILIKQ